MRSPRQRQPKNRLLSVANNAGALIVRATERLRASGSVSPRLDAELLLGKVLGCSRTALLAHPELALTDTQEHQVEGLVARRADAEPMAYLLGEREFFGRMFRVDARALIPRPETELLVDLGCRAVDRWRTAGAEPTVVELGTGCGAVAISLAAERSLRVTATDVSWAALTLAADNSRHLRQEVAFAQCDLLRGLRGPLHVVLANLPYVPEARALPRDVLGYEPTVALFGGERGTELIERVLLEAQDLLAPGGEMCMELDEEEQATPVANLAKKLYREVEVLQDAGGYDRVVRVVS
jgi:release factor glutamine methyltransferase